MAAYLVLLKDTHPGQRRCDGMVITAATSADALAYAKAKFAGDSSAAWADATVVTLADVAANAPGLAGWRLRVKILNSTPPVDVTVVGTGADDTIDEIATLMAAALNAIETPQIANAVYVGATQTLTIAGAADNLGDKKVEVEFYPPAAAVEDPEPIPGLVGTITDEGAAGAALTVVFPADTYVIPTLYRTIHGRVQS